MQATTRHADGVTVVTLEGDLDKLTSDAARVELERAVGPGAVLVDLSPVTFLDSAGLHVLFRLARATAKAGTRLGLVVPAGSPLRRLVEITNVDDVASVCESVEEGLGLLTGVSGSAEAGTGASDQPAD